VTVLLFEVTEETKVNLSPREGEGCVIILKVFRAAVATPILRGRRDQSE